MPGWILTTRRSLNYEYVIMIGVVYIISVMFDTITYKFQFTEKKNQIESLFVVMFTASGHFNSMKTSWITILRFYGCEFLFQ